jgi:hypothetical protein
MPHWLNGGAGSGSTWQVFVITEKLPICIVGSLHKVKL